MRHHFTKSERLALDFMHFFWHEFSDMEAQPNRKGAWIPATTTTSRIYLRRGRRVVIFTLVDPCFPLYKAMRISLEGRETRTVSGNNTESETRWRIAKIMMGYDDYEGERKWYRLVIPDDKHMPIDRQFPHFLMETETISVASTDA